MRDSKGRWMKGFNPLTEDDGRHVLTKRDRQKGYAITQQLIQQGKMPSRLAVSVRKKIRREIKRRE